MTEKNLIGYHQPLMLKQHPFGHLMGGILLVAGTSIGAGMLALPIVTGEAGFFPSLAIYLLCWAFMTATGLLLLEICLKHAPDANLVSLSGAYLGKSGKAFAWILYLFLFYCLSIAYISGGSGLLFDWTGIPRHYGCLLFVSILAPFVYIGAKAVDRINWIFMSGLIVSYLIFVVLGSSAVSEKLLFQTTSWKGALYALPVIFTSFAYQGVIPTLATYMRRDPFRLKVAIVGGTTLAFAIYLLWEWMILGIVPTESLVAAKAAGMTAVQPLRDVTGIGTVYAIGQSFAFFAITTSYLGVTLGLMDFLADALRMPKLGWRRGFLALLTFVPPLIVALTNPSIFIHALVLAAGIGCSLLLGFLPTLLAAMSRARRESGPVLLKGGAWLFGILFLFVLIELSFEFNLW